MEDSLSLLSPAVLSIIAVSAILLGYLRGISRQIAFFALNLTFLIFCLLGPQGTVLTLGFSLLGYLLIRNANGATGWIFGAGVVGFVLLFIYMKDYTFLHLMLPQSLLTSALSTVGLSFLFFKILHVVIDGRSGTLGPFDGWTYANYCTNFSTFTMGPIQRYQDHRAQWRDETSEPPLAHYLDAVIRILAGFVKAYVLAEWIKPYTGALTLDPAMRSTTELLFGIYAFNLYLYLNFAGYCDVAIGAGTLFGIRAPENFDKPFLAKNVSDFWQRQHRTLTLWLTDYVFTPTFKRLLETERAWMTPLLAANLAIMLTMVVSGLWHGTSVGFLLFGLLHGAYLVVYRMWDSALTARFGKQQVRTWRAQWWAKAIGIAITFNAISFSFLFFLLDARTAVRVIGRLLWP